MIRAIGVLLIGLAAWTALGLDVNVPEQKASPAVSPDRPRKPILPRKDVRHEGD
jgi:hypothetical protein